MTRLDPFGAASYLIGTRPIVPVSVLLLSTREVEDVARSASQRTNPQDDDRAVGSACAFRPGYVATREACRRCQVTRGWSGTLAATNVGGRLAALIRPVLRDETHSRPASDPQR